LNDGAKTELKQLRSKVQSLEAELQALRRSQGEIYSLYAEMLYVLSMEVYGYSFLYKWPGSDGLARDLVDRLLLAELIQGQELAPYPNTLTAALKLWFPKSRWYRIRVVRSLVRGAYRSVRFVGRALRGKK